MIKKVILIIILVIIPSFISEGLPICYKTILNIKETEKKVEEKKTLDLMSISLQKLINVNFTVKKGKNNPGNLRDFHTGKFRRFKTMKEGYDALIYDLSIKISGESIHTDSTTTIRKFVNIYAPKFENDTKKYIKIICTELKVNPNIKLHTVNVHKLAKAIIKVEDIELYKKMYKNECNTSNKDCRSKVKKS